MGADRQAGREAMNTTDKERELEKEPKYAAD